VLGRLDKTRLASIRAPSSMEPLAALPAFGKKILSVVVIAVYLACSRLEKATSARYCGAVQIRRLLVVHVWLIRVSHCDAAAPHDPLTAPNSLPRILVGGDRGERDLPAAVAAVACLPVMKGGNVGQQLENDCGVRPFLPDGPDTP